VTIADDGPGVDLTKPRSGLGLVGMRERVESLGGEFHVASRAGEGFMLCARVPCHAGLPEPSGPNEASVGATMPGDAAAVRSAN
jgi:two-component system, NarL family, sensor histidine kinase UhpB